MQFKFKSMCRISRSRCHITMCCRFSCRCPATANRIQCVSHGHRMFCCWSVAGRVGCTRAVAGHLEYVVATVDVSTVHSHGTGRASEIVGRKRASGRRSDATEACFSRWWGKCNFAEVSQKIETCNSAARLRTGLVESKTCYGIVSGTGHHVPESGGKIDWKWIFL